GRRPQRSQYIKRGRWSRSDTVLAGPRKEGGAPPICKDSRAAGSLRCVTKRKGGSAAPPLPSLESSRYTPSSRLIKLSSCWIAFCAALLSSKPDTAQRRLPSSLPAPG